MHLKAHGTLFFTNFEVILKKTMSENQMQQEINIEIDDAVAVGHYSNLAIISHSPTEFVIDFAAVLPAVPKTKVRTRVILTPEHAKRLLLSLQENITRYETNVQRIDIHSAAAQEEPEQIISAFNIGEA